jgi:glutamine cyclotransferase
VAFTDRIIARMRACPDVELSSTVSQAFVLRGKADGTTVALWRLQNQVAQGRPAANYWTGVTRVGSYVAQLTFTPTPQYDVNRDTFKALVVRARDRLYELKQ